MEYHDFTRNHPPMPLRDLFGTGGSSHESAPFSAHAEKCNRQSAARDVSSKKFVAAIKSL